MKLALGMIVKNEAPILRKTLSVLDKSQFTDMIAVDHGSTDGTVKALCNAGFKVFQRDWDNHFAAARNDLLEKIKDQFDGVWVLMLDADEAMFPKDIEVLKLGLTDATAQVVCLPRLNLFGEKSESYDLMSGNDWQPRCVRLDPSVHFRNSIHEWPYESNRRCLTNNCSSFIYHYSLCKPAPEIALRWENYDRMAKGEPLLTETTPCNHDDLKKRYEAEGRLKLWPVNFNHPLKDLYA